jgi:hypothetical protein
MTGVEVLAEPDWLAREAAHVERMRRWTGPHQERRSRGEKHPVLDFLFTEMCACVGQGSDLR